MSLSLKTGSNASEEFVKEMGSGIKPVPSVMHIATHGFSFASPKLEVRHEKSFLQNDNKQVFRSSEDALTRAGLVMAGGNKFWTTGTTYQNHEDGILTAREISELNLNGCILATLSACETGLGEIKGSEGVFGLQRAFKMAGVKYLIVSLWKVPDAQTTEFMQLFYSSWLIQKLPIREAFHQTQLTMSKKHLPYQWAAFVLVE
jgi:CHAT domain-containing protein